MNLLLETFWLRHDVSHSIVDSGISSGVLLLILLICISLIYVSYLSVSKINNHFIGSLLVIKNNFYSGSLRVFSYECNELRSMAFKGYLF